VRAFFDLWYPRLVRFLHARVADVDMAEDLAQEAFVRLLRHRPRRPRTWLFTVAENLARDEARLARGRARHLQVIHAERAAERDLGPEPEMLRREEARSVTRALDRLPERDRSLLMLHHAGFRYREIAREVGVAPGSVGSLLTRAQRRFLDTFREVHEREARRNPRVVP
jgi:RNA polymerase sigma-70 factor (ECF subfamily)